MRPELSAQLRAAYALIFNVEPIANPDDPDMPAIPSAFASWGFECADGWFDLIDVLCATLQNATANGAPQVVATQVKEKFGVLRFYANGHNAVQEGMIELAEMISARLCEVCGNRGRVIRDQWIRTRCPEHEQN
ncbi:hypothetical protein [Paraburkholderia sp. BR10954]|uniref:hypothetical protein n=1 Tax=Paraburkholderia sp. BR10954 TaxID=3236995 RepID=UPI0034D1941D